MVRLIQWLLIGSLLLISPLALAESRGEALAQVKLLIDKNQTRLLEIDASITKSLMDIRNLGIAQTSAQKTKLIGFEKELEQLAFQKKEHLMRQDFLDRLSFQVDRYFQGGDLKAFLDKKTLEMAQTEISSPEGNSNMWKFLSHLSLAIKELPERHEAPFAFIEGYMKFSTLLNPSRPDEYLSLRNYTNGNEFETAEPMDADRVGEVVEEKIKEAQSMVQKDRLPFEERKTYLKPMTQTFQEAPSQALNPQPLPVPEIKTFEPPAMIKEELQKTQATEPTAQSEPVAQPVPLPQAQPEVQTSSPQVTKTQLPYPYNKTQTPTVADDMTVELKPAVKN